jgi:hypothetical protein
MALILFNNDTVILNGVYWLFATKSVFLSILIFKTFITTRAPSGSSNAAQPPPSGGLHPQHKNTLNTKLILYIQSYTYFYSHNLPTHLK